MHDLVLIFQSSWYPFANEPFSTCFFLGQQLQISKGLIFMASLYLFLLCSNQVFSLVYVLCTWYSPILLFILIKFLLIKIKKYPLANKLLMDWICRSFSHFSSFLVLGLNFSEFVQSYYCSAIHFLLLMPRIFCIHFFAPIKEIPTISMLKFQSLYYQKKKKKIQSLTCSVFLFAALRMPRGLLILFRTFRARSILYHSILILDPSFDQPVRQR